MKPAPIFESSGKGKKFFFSNENGRKVFGEREREREREIERERERI